MQKSFRVVVHGDAAPGSGLMLIGANAKNGHKTLLFPREINKKALIA